MRNVCGKLPEWLVIPHFSSLLLEVLNLVLNVLEDCSVAFYWLSDPQFWSHRPLISCCGLVCTLSQCAVSATTQPTLQQLLPTQLPAPALPQLSHSSHPLPLLPDRLSVLWRLLFALIHFPLYGLSCHFAIDSCFDSTVAEHILRSFKSLNS